MIIFYVACWWFFGGILNILVLKRTGSMTNSDAFMCMLGGFAWFLLCGFFVFCLSDLADKPFKWFK